MLLERALKLLPADLRQWSRTCKDKTLVGEELIVLADQYKSLQATPAFQHYQGMIWDLKGKIENGILQGTYDGTRDVTPHLRAIYGVLLQIIAIPSQIENKTIAAEYQAYLRDLEHDIEV